MSQELAAELPCLAHFMRPEQNYLKATANGLHPWKSSGLLVHCKCQSFGRSLLVHVCTGVEATCKVSSQVTSEVTWIQGPACFICLQQQNVALCSVRPGTISECIVFDLDLFRYFLFGHGPSAPNPQHSNSDSQKHVMSSICESPDLNRQSIADPFVLEKSGGTSWSNYSLCCW